MHDVLKERVWRRIQALPQDQIYQVLDYIEFLEAKYAKEQAREPDALQKFAERVEDSLRMRSVAPKVISGTVGLLGSARRVMRTVSDAGRDILGTPPEAGARPPSDHRPVTRAWDTPRQAPNGPTTPAPSSGPSSTPAQPSASNPAAATTPPAPPRDTDRVKEGGARSPGDELEGPARSPGQLGQPDVRPPTDGTTTDNHGTP
jgi:hypothetical protein